MKSAKQLKKKFLETDSKAGGCSTRLGHLGVDLHETGLA